MKPVKGYVVKVKFTHFAYNRDYIKNYYIDMFGNSVELMTDARIFTYESLWNSNSYIEYTGNKFEIVPIALVPWSYVEEEFVE